MSKSAGESIRLFKPLFAAGMILVAFGIFCIWIGTSVISLKEEGEGFKILSKVTDRWNSFHHPWFSGKIL